MEIYLVQEGDTIESIALKYGVSIGRLLHDNGIENPISLVPGQALVIAIPDQTHTVQEGDTLESIAKTYNVSIFQLLRNNSFLSNREYIFPGENLVINYNTSYKVYTTGYVYTYINREILKKTLPYLSYLSVFNYNLTEDGAIITRGEDLDIIELAKAYGTKPLMMISSISPKGEPNTESIYTVLINKEYQEQLIATACSTLRNTGYAGINILVSGLNESTQDLYIDLFTNISKAAREEGFQFFLTLNPNLRWVNGNVQFEKLDYLALSNLVDGITILQYLWGTNYGPPSPVSSIALLEGLAQYIVSIAPPDKFSIGSPLLGYDWELPYNPYNTYAYSLTLNSVLALASDVDAIIEFDKQSQTPFFMYKQSYVGSPINHIVWFIDARSIYALTKLLEKYQFVGSGLWNVMIFNQQVWTVIISEADIIKVIGENDISNTL